MKKPFCIYIGFKNERKTPVINKTDRKAEEQPIQEEEIKELDVDVKPAKVKPKSKSKMGVYSRINNIDSYLIQ